jgi:TATA element modulatory factor
MAELAALQQRHSAAVELLGEREEALAELRADVEDMKALYRDQVDALATQLATALGHS